MSLFCNLSLSFCIVVGLIKLGHRFFIGLKAFYFLINACHLYWKINKTLKFLDSGSMDLDQKQAYVFFQFNKIFYSLSCMCSEGSLLMYAKVDLQKYFWKKFTQKHPFFYIKGFSLWALDEVNGSCRFVKKKQAF
jgi:hypothetical protein